MDVPGWVVTATIWTYWIGVGAMIVRVRRHTRRVVGVVPEQRLERTMWLIWVPLVAAWAALPWLALHRAGSPWGLPEFALGGSYAAARWAAAAVAVACLAATIRCWARMGKDWRMAVTREENQALITDGMFSRVRHPIYALSILLMMATMVIVPTVPMLVVGAIHIGLMIVKAGNEERHMLTCHGDAYARYLARTGRFLPRFR
ncbi:MAG: isoprenylcysteine carboxylmethyltransferase family protein [Betaproteobacteria bacterium]|nr:isoprenylcysteine carboxylmethyltransferase family protein [Betaproteobacteria bacterium]MCC7217299.1 isoprenylcysteine carboxylmethyltransferase family protein [Burkholderiales bacterium]